MSESRKGSDRPELLQPGFRDACEQTLILDSYSRARSTVRRIRTEFDNAITSMGMSREQASLLEQMDNLGAATAKQLGRHLGIRGDVVRQLAASLEGREMVARESTRARHLTLSLYGSAVVRLLADRREALIRQSFQGMDLGELEVLNELLRKLG